MAEQQKRVLRLTEEIFFAAQGHIFTQKVL